MNKFFLALLLMCLFASPAWGAAATIDGSSGDGTCPNGGTSPYSWTSHSVAGNLLLVGVGMTNYLDSVTGITYGGSPLTLLARIDSSATSDLSAIEVWYRKSPAAGTNTVQVTLTSGITYGSCAIAVTINNVDLISTFGSPVTATLGSNGTSISSSVTGATNGLVIDFVHTGGGTPPSGLTQTQTLIGSILQGNYIAVGSSYATGAGSKTMGWSWTNSLPASQIGVLVNGSGFATPVRRRVVVVQ